jgi:hypothetical protein
MAHLTGKIDMLGTEIRSLNNNLTMQMKSFTEAVSAQISVLIANMKTNNASMESRLDKLENRLLFGMPFAVRGLLRVCYILLSNNYEGVWCGDSWGGWYRRCPWSAENGVSIERRHPTAY